MMETVVETIAFTDRPISQRQLIDELKGLALPDNAFAGVRRSNRTILADGSIRREDHHTIEVKLRAAVSAADKRRIAAVVEAHVPQTVPPTRLAVLREANDAYQRGEGDRLTVEELRELTELSL